MPTPFVINEARCCGTFGNTPLGFWSVANHAGHHTISRGDRAPMTVTMPATRACRATAEESTRKRAKRATEPTRAPRKVGAATIHTSNSLITSAANATIAGPNNGRNDSNTCGVDTGSIMKSGVNGSHRTNPLTTGSPSGWRRSNNVPGRASAAAQHAVAPAELLRTATPEAAATAHSLTPRCSTRRERADVTSR